MMKALMWVFVYGVGLGSIFVQGVKADEKDVAMQFSQYQQQAWKTVFMDSGTQDWQEYWVLDGQEATVENSADGMAFAAGPEAFNDAHHAVLWTKQDFKGDLKIEYDYTRLDEEIRMVNILYIQATGSGEPGYDTDISKWADKRTVPTMSTYFRNMNTYHISYAAFGVRNKTPGNDYIRARRYMCKGIGGTEMENEYVKTGMFAPGVEHHITIIKKDRDLYMHIQNPENELLCHFVNTQFPPITEGKIGLRHMYTRSARYRNFRVSELAADAEKTQQGKR